MRWWGLLGFSLLLFLGCHARYTPASGAAHPKPFVIGEMQPFTVSDTPTYTADGRLIFPKNYREWVYLSTGMDMSYSEASRPPSQSIFDNVFVNPAAYRGFQVAGTWPDKTVFMLEVRSSASKGSINQRGHYQSEEILGMEAHVKDSKFPGQWAFFHFDAAGNGTLIPRSADCYTCHEQHGAVDTTFVQFYPTLIAIAQQHGTYHVANP